MAQAAADGRLDDLAALVTAGGDLTLADANGVTPLHAAATHGRLACVQHLLSLPAVAATANAVDEDGVTAVYSAAEEGHVDVLAALVAAGGDVTLADADGVTPLHVAASQGHLACVQYLLSLPAAAATVNAADKVGDTALYSAAEEGHVEVLAALVAAGGDVTLADANGVTPLHAAATHGRLACVQHLLSLPAVAATANAVDEDGVTAVYSAAEEGHVDVLAALVAAGGDVTLADADGVTPLHVAASQGHLACVQYLLSLPAAAATVNAADQVGDTAVYSAAGGGHVEVLAALVAAGGSATCRNARGMTPLRGAAHHGHLACVQYLLSLPAAAAAESADDEEGESAVHYAAGGGHVEVLAALVAAGGSVTLASISGHTPLLAAADSGDLACVQYLLSMPAAAATINSFGQDGLTPVFLAAGRKSVEALAALVAAGGDVTLASSDVTPLHFAVRCGQLDCAQYLLSLPAAVSTIDEADATGQTALYSAARLGRAELLAALVEAGGDATLVNTFGTAPLHIAAKNGHLACVKCLLSVPAVAASIDDVDGDGETALFTAAGKGHLEVLAALVEAGADAALVNDEGVTPLHCAVASRHLACVTYLLSVPAAAATVNTEDVNGNTSVTAAGTWEVEPLAALVAAGGDVAVANADGGTPLLMSAYYGSLACLQYLLTLPAAAATVNAVDDSGGTAMFYAAREGHAQELAALVAAGGDVTLANMFDMTPLHAAVLFGQMACVQYLLSLPAVDVDAVNRSGETADRQADRDASLDVLVSQVFVQCPAVSHELCFAPLLTCALALSVRVAVSRSPALSPSFRAPCLARFVCMCCGRSEVAGAGGRRCGRRGWVRSPSCLARWRRGGSRLGTVATKVATGPARRHCAVDRGFVGVCWRWPATRVSMIGSRGVHPVERGGLGPRSLRGAGGLSRLWPCPGGGGKGWGRG